MDECKPLDGGGADGAGALGKAVQVDPIKTTSKAPQIELLKLKHDKPLSNFAFKFNLRHYNWVMPPTGLLALDFVSFVYPRSPHGVGLSDDVLTHRPDTPGHGSPQRGGGGASPSPRVGRLRSFPGSLKWRSTVRKCATLSK